VTRFPLFAVLFLSPAVALAQPAKPASGTGKPTQAEWQAVVDKATKYLKDKQDDKGGWSTDKNIGVTGVAVTGLLQTGTKPDAEPAAKGLKFIEGLINEKAGHIAGADPRVGLQNYVTSVNVMALVAARQDDKYKKVVGNAAEFLKKLQWDDGEGKKDADDFFGGAGYDSKSRPDLSNTQFFLDALVAAGVKQDDPAFKKVQVFVSRCQNYKSEHNTAPWAGKVNDGSFVYSAAAGGSTKTTDDPLDGSKDALPGYGSMTYAGVKSLIYAGVGKDDPRVKTALAWLKKNYTVDTNPGMPPQLAARGLYYYYHTMSKALDVLGEDTFEDEKGVKHDWRTDLFRAIEKRQKADGSWTNETDRWMEGDPALVSGYMLMALSHCKPK
jgi:squalene-hopene/tetraprenyl-beta-curcumene cyclase